MEFFEKITGLGTKIKGLHRLPAVYFVSISDMGLVYRQRRMIYKEKKPLIYN